MQLCPTLLAVVFVVESALTLSLAPAEALHGKTFLDWEFAVFDANGDGFVSEPELSALFTDDNGEVFSYDQALLTTNYGEQNAILLLELFDANTNGLVELEEMREVFDSMDVNGDDLVSRQESRDYFEIGKGEIYTPIEKRYEASRYIKIPYPLLKSFRRGRSARCPPAGGSRPC